MRKKLLSALLAAALLLALFPAGARAVETEEGLLPEMAESNRMDGEEPVENEGFDAQAYGDQRSSVPDRIEIFREGNKLTPTVGDWNYEEYITIGGSALYSARVYDQDAGLLDYGVIWSVSDQSRAGCVQNTDGSVTVTSLTGEAFTLYAAVPNSTKSLRADIDITPTMKQTPQLTGVPDRLTLSIGDQSSVKAVSDSSGAIHYKSSAPAVARVDADGNVTALREGDAEITVSIEATEDYIPASKTVPVTVSAKPLQDSWILPIQDQVYTGAAIIPAITVMDGEKQLVEDDDYIFADCKQNTDVGTAYISIFGFGAYTGLAEATFKITRAPVTVNTSVPSVEISADDSRNTGLPALKALLGLPEEVEASYAGGTIELRVGWDDPTAPFHKKGGTYTFTGNIDVGNNFQECGKLEATVTVRPVQVTDISSAGLRDLTLARADVLAEDAAFASLGIPETLTVRYDTGGAEEIAAQWDGTLEDLKALAGEAADAQRQMTLRLDPGCLPEWASYTADVLPSITITVTPKQAAQITIPAIADRTYDGAAAGTPTLSAEDGRGNALSGGVWTYTYRGVNGTVYESNEAPRDAGSYVLAASYDGGSYQGSGVSEVFTIRPRPVTLAWSGMGTDAAPLVYTGRPADVTASLPDGAPAAGDTVNVAVAGGRETNAGTYTARASLSSGNYSAVNAEQTYTIARASRSLTLGPAELHLYPASGLSGTVTADFDDADGSGTLVFALADGGARIAALSGSGRSAAVTAVDNGTVKLTASLAATENYDRASAEVLIKALPRPVLGVRAADGDESPNLSAALSGSVIRVVGLGDPETAEVILTLADVDGLTQENGEGTVTLRVGGDVAAVYQVDLSGVKKAALPPDTSIVPGPSEARAPAAAGQAVQDAAARMRPQASGLTAAASDELEAVANAEAAENKTVVIEAGLQIQVEALEGSAAGQSLLLDIQPVYTVKVGGLATKTGALTGTLRAPVAITVVLPDGFAAEDLYARHYDAGGTAVREYLPVRLSGNTASWEQASFSKTAIVQDARKAVVTFDSGAAVQTVRFTPDCVGKPLPDSGTADHGWTIEGRTYTHLTDGLLTLLAEKAGEGPYTVGTTDAPEPSVPDRPAPVEPSGPALPGGAGSGSSASGTGGRSRGTGGVSWSMASVSAAGHGAVELRPRYPGKGTTVTLRVRPDSGYVLESLRVLDAGGAEVPLTKGEGMEYTFQMPAGRITVDARFAGEAEDGGFPFADAAESWARDAIAWAWGRGYVRGVRAAAFAPDGLVTRQQVWMILARVSGRTPADMAEAREWAVSCGVTSGGDGGSAVTRQQMAAFLCRCARSQGLAAGEDAAPDRFPDGGAVSAYARGPLAWAVDAGIVEEASGGALDPGGAVTRAQFAVILQRFCAHLEGQ